VPVPTKILDNSVLVGEGSRLQDRVQELAAELRTLIERYGLINVLSALSRIVGANESKAGIDKAEAKTWSLAENAIERAHIILLYHFGV
jgi:hypothetical protein